MSAIFLRFAFAVCLFAVAIGLVWPGGLYALPLMQRSLSVGTPEAGATTEHTFSFTYASTDPVGSIVFEYCTSPLETISCNAPAGVDVSAAVLDGESGETGFMALGVVDATANRVVIARPSSPVSLTPSSYNLANIVNPTNIEEFFVRISTYASVDGTGATIDYGAVVSAIVPGVNISSEVPPYLKFCVGLTITDDDCETAAGDTIDLGVLSPTETRRGTSQMVAATNGQFGLAITVQGRTMTSGNHELPPLDSPTPSQPGTSQFGINLRANSSPFVGANPSGSGIANPEPDYNIPNHFAFREQDVVATSPTVTDTRRFTVSYIANVSKKQHPGVYAATVTFICTATF